MGRVSSRPFADVVPRLADLSQNWRRRAEDLRPFAESAARAFEEAAKELQEALEATDGGLVNLSDASRLSGFAPDSLARMIRQGKLENRGRPGAPRLRVADLPKKARTIAARDAEPYDVDADARALLAAGRAIK
jgi:hypothetical protein